MSEGCERGNEDKSRWYISSRLGKRVVSLFPSHSKLLPPPQWISAPAHQQNPRGLCSSSAILSQLLWGWSFPSCVGFGVCVCVFYNP